ncbi:MAG: response regulator, partial [Leptolyngbyaceae cyanobacterium SM2_3_12]|nr:response regulator [Leptolyngbyaceae cyanobacterium SM2_3_12]
MDDVLRPNDLVIVDDDVETLRLLTRLLTPQGYGIQEATTGKQALEIIAGKLPDLVLLDVMLPDIDGFAICQQLKADPLTQDIPIIFLSSLADSLDKVKAFQTGAADYISKPFAVQEVLVRVQNQLHLSRQRQQLSHQNALLTQEVQERMLMQQALLAAEMNYRSIFENSTVGIFKTSAGGQYLSVNPSMARLYGYDSADEMMAMTSNVSHQIYLQPKRRDELMVYLNRFDKITDAESEVFRK